MSLLQSLPSRKFGIPRGWFAGPDRTSQKGGPQKCAACVCVLYGCICGNGSLDFNCLVRICHWTHKLLSFVQSRCSNQGVCVCVLAAYFSQVCLCHRYLQPPEGRHTSCCCLFASAYVTLVCVSCPVSSALWEGFPRLIRPKKDVLVCVWPLAICMCVAISSAFSASMSRS